MQNKSKCEIGIKSNEGSKGNQNSSCSIIGDMNLDHSTTGNEINGELNLEPIIETDLKSERVNTQIHQDTFLDSLKRDTLAVVVEVEDFIDTDKYPKSIRFEPDKLTIDVEVNEVIGDMTNNSEEIKIC